MEEQREGREEADGGQVGEGEGEREGEAAGQAEGGEGEEGEEVGRGEEGRGVGEGELAHGGGVVADSEGQLLVAAGEGCGGDAGRGGGGAGGGVRVALECDTSLLPPALEAALGPLTPLPLPGAHRRRDRQRRGLVSAAAFNPGTEGQKKWGTTAEC